MFIFVFLINVYVFLLMFISDSDILLEKVGGNQNILHAATNICIPTNDKSRF